MAIIVKYCLLFLGMVGISSAIGFPLAMKSGGSISSNISGGDINQVSISRGNKPASDGGTEIDFGDKKSENACGSVNLNQESETSLDDYTTLFKEKGNSNSERGSNSNKQGSEGKTVCGVSGVISAGIQDEEYLGACEWNAGDKKLFLKKKVDESSRKVKLSICQGECFSVGAANFMKDGEKPLEGKGSEVTFKSENKK